MPYPAYGIKWTGSVDPGDWYVHVNRDEFLHIFERLAKKFRVPVLSTLTFSMRKEEGVRYSVVIQRASVYNASAGLSELRIELA